MTREIEGLARIEILVSNKYFIQGGVVDCPFCIRNYCILIEIRNEFFDLIG